MTSLPNDDKTNATTAMGPTCLGGWPMPVPSPPTPCPQSFLAASRWSAAQFSRSICLLPQRSSLHSSLSLSPMIVRDEGAVVIPEEGEGAAITSGPSSGRARPLSRPGEIKGGNGNGGDDRGGRH